MHADEVETDAGLVRRLLSAQFPQWSGLRVERVPSFGTDNALYRLGDDLVVRLPRIDWAASDIDKDARWLDQLRPLVPVAIPQQLATGTPGLGFPWRWGIYRWLEGCEPGRRRNRPSRGPRPRRGQVRGGTAPSSTERHPDGLARGAARRAGRRGTASDPRRRRRARRRGRHGSRETALRAPAWGGPAVWTHGDLLRGNLLLREGRLAAVIDWSLLGVGDPACDAIVAWSVLPRETRDVFRTEAGFDDATWARGRGWALCCGLLQVPYYAESNPELADNGRHMVGEILAEANVRS
jgi:aminoglycoside phosphotransferase (APT) family kinase protein